MNLTAVDISYSLITIPGDGLALLFSGEYGRQLWVQCKMRKTHKCYECDATYPVGTGMYRPMTNGYNRMQRICAQCIQMMR